MPLYKPEFFGGLPKHRVLHEEDAMQEGEGGGEEGEGDGDGEGGDGDDEAAGNGEVGDGAGSRLTKPKKLAISQLTKIHWPSGELCHVLMELVSTGGSAPNILSLGARAVLPDGSSPASPAGSQPRKSLVRLVPQPKLIRTRPLKWR